MHRVAATVLLLAMGVGCASDPASTEHSLEHGGRQRTFAVHLPPAYSAPAPGGATPAPLPLVVVYHGGGGNADIAARSSKFSALADRAGFVVAYPNGTGKLTGMLLTWNSGGIPVYAVEQDVDDVGFTKAMVDDLARRYRIDRTRVYATGMSNGGMMVHRLAREAADVFAAVCDVSGAMNFTRKEPAAKIGVMICHGRADQHVLYEGGRPKVSVGGSGERTDTSVDAAVAYYLGHNELDTRPERKVDGVVTVERYAKTRSGEAAAFEVVLVVIDGEGHTWPGGEAGSRRGDTPTRAFDATQAAWDFFSRHTRPPASK